GVLRAAGRDADRHLRAIGRGLIVVDRLRLAAGGLDEGRDVDERAPGAVLLAYHQVVDVGARLALQVEHPPGRLLHRVDEAERGAQCAQLLEVRGTRCDRVEYAARPGALRLHPRERRRILGLDEAEPVGQLAAEVVLLDRPRREVGRLATRADGSDA